MYKDWLKNLQDFQLGNFSYRNAGFDDFLSDSSSEGMIHTASAPSRIKVASVGDLSGFERYANSDTLIRKSEKDLWALTKNDDGDLVLEALYDDDGKPLTV